MFVFGSAAWLGTGAGAEPLYVAEPAVAVRAVAAFVVRDTDTVGPELELGSDGIEFGAGAGVGVEAGAGAGVGAEGLVLQPFESIVFAPAPPLSY